MGMALTLYENCRQQIAKHGPGRLEKVSVQIGELTGIQPELLEFAWQAVLADSADEGCRLDIEWKPASQYCPVCRAEKPRPDSGWVIICPDCDAPLRVEGGYELDLMEITYESDVPEEKQA